MIITGHHRMSLGHAFLALSICLGISVAACSRSDSSSANSATGQPAVADQFVIATPNDVDGLFPPTSTTLQGFFALHQLFDRLAEPDSTLNIVGDAHYRPRLATRWEWAPDSLSIAFHLDPRARWHDGAPVTARDVRSTLRIYRDSAVGGPAISLLRNIDSVSVRDSLTAVIWFKHRSSQQFFDATYQMRVLPSHLLDSIAPSALRTSAFAHAPIGSGPYRFKKRTPGVSVEFVADSTYYLGRPSFRRVILLVTRDRAAALARVRAGEADFLEAASPAEIAQVVHDSALKAIEWPSLEHGAIYFNLRDPIVHEKSHPVLGDVRVRRAIGLALDREALVRNVFDSLAHVARGPVAGVLLD